MNLKELHNPTLRQEDNRLYLVWHPTKEPKEYMVIEREGIDNTWNEVAKNPKHTKWLQSEVKYQVRESDRDVIERHISQSFKHGTHGDFKDQLREGIICNPELMEMLELLNTDLFHDGNYQNFCSQCKVAFMGHKRQLVCKKCCDSKIIVTLKEEPKGGSEDDLWNEILNDTSGMIWSDKGTIKDLIIEFKNKFTITRKQP